MASLSLLAANNDFFLLFKPAGLVVNRSRTTQGKITLVDLLEKSGLIARRFHRHLVFWRRQGLVHRLDKETSGLILGAFHPRAFAFFRQQFRYHRIKKQYWALVWGELPPRGKIQLPLAKAGPNQRYPVVVSSQGKASLTYFYRQRVWQRGRQKLSLLRLRPFSGRTHQIRAHFRYLGFPLWGDRIYSPYRGREKQLLGQGGSQLFLYAFSLSFRDLAGRYHSFRLDLPPELKKVILDLQAHGFRQTNPPLAD